MADKPKGKTSRSEKRTLRGIVVDKSLADDAAKRRERLEKVMDAVTAFVPLVAAYSAYCKTLGLDPQASPEANIAAIRERYPFAFEG